MRFLTHAEVERLARATAIAGFAVLAARGGSTAIKHDEGRF